MKGITIDPAIMTGKPCIQGTRVTVGTILSLLAAGDSISTVLDLYPYITENDIRNALAYGAWRSEEREIEIAI